MAEITDAAGKPYKLFSQQFHPEYRSRYWARCRSLYSGDFTAMVEDVDPTSKARVVRKVLEDVFPKRNAETADDYERRKAQAFYINYPGSILDKIVAGLFREQPAMEAKPKPDSWYERWFKDVSRPGGQVMSFNDLLKAQMLIALQTQRAWTLIELPATPEAMPQSLADQERDGDLDCYACPIEPECVRDWEVDDDGALAWVLLAFQRSKREGLEGSREMVQEEFVYYTPTDYSRYVVEYKKGSPPGPEDTIRAVAFGPHSFGRVPLCMLELTPGMFAMGKLESLARAHLNLVNSLHWATINSLFPTPTAFQSEETPNNPATEDPKRALKQKRSPTHIVTLGKEDRFEFIGPSAEPFAQANRQANNYRDEMYRIVHAMADSVDNSGAALQRSGDSKQADKESEAIVFKWLGEKLNSYACEILGCVGAGRGDPECEWVMKGMEEFGTEDSKALLEEAQAVTLLDINSPSFQADYKFKTAKAVMGDDVNPERLAKYRKELEQNNPPEEYDPEAKRERQEAMKAQMQPKSGEQPTPQSGQGQEQEKQNGKDTTGAAKAAEKE